MFLYQGRWKQIPSFALHWSVQSLPDHCIQTVTQESPVSSLNSSQTAEQAKVNGASGEPANSLSVSPACLSHRSMWAQGHLVFNLGLAPCALSNLCLSMGAPWRRKLLRRVSGKGGGEPRCKAWRWSAVTELDYWWPFPTVANASLGTATGRGERTEACWPTCSHQTSKNTTLAQHLLPATLNN